MQLTLSTTRGTYTSPCPVNYDGISGGACTASVPRDLFVRGQSLRGEVTLRVSRSGSVGIASQGKIQLVGRPADVAAVPPLSVFLVGPYRATHPGEVANFTVWAHRANTTVKSFSVSLEFDNQLLKFSGNITFAPGWMVRLLDNSRLCRAPFCEHAELLVCTLCDWKCRVSSSTSFLCLQPHPAPLLCGKASKCWAIPVQKCCNVVGPRSASFSCTGRPGLHAHLLVSAGEKRCLEPIWQP